MIRTTTAVLAAGVLLAALLLDAPGLVAVMAVCGVLLAFIGHADRGSATDAPLALAMAGLAVSWWWSPLAATSPWPYAAWLLVAAGVARAARASHVYRFLVAGLVGGGATLLGYSALIRLTTPGSERLIVYPAIAHWGQYPELGIVAVIVVPLAAAVLLGAQAPATRAAAALLLAVSVVGLALTSSRAAWVASAIALLPLAAAGRRRLAAVLIGVAVVGGLVGMQVEPARRVATEVSAATDTRGEAWVHALDLWRERPLVGWGPGAYQTAHVKVFGPSNAPAAHSAHNLPLQIGVEFGLLGLLAFSWLALRVFEPAVTIVRAPRPAGLDGLLALGVIGALAGLTARLLVDAVDPVGHSQRVCFEVAIVVGLMAASISLRGFTECGPAAEGCRLARPTSRRPAARRHRA